MITVKTMSKIDAPTAPKLEELLNNKYAEDQDVIIDMADTGYICSVGLRVILAFQKKISGNGGSLVIKNVQPQIMEIFEVTGFVGFLSIE